MKGNRISSRSFKWILLSRFASMVLLAGMVLCLEPGHAGARELHVQVIKACQDCILPAAPAACQSSSFHRDMAATWTPGFDIRIHAVSIPEQSEVSIYADIEVSTSPEMYLPEGHIFRVKYAGPGILRDPPCSASFTGSNITTTNIAFPAGTWISVKAGTPIYVHMDVKNWSPYEVEPMAQDVYLYYCLDIPFREKGDGAGD